ncbi:serine palmitoyltransferase 2 [Trichomonascus vanleenenianus]|uniref:serine C-palmitoyltransferase LCB2 n=1 Tax=Trichomonascus vanleenenianus TaxID=2268995 RepID=UPI003EC96220
MIEAMSISPIITPASTDQEKKLAAAAAAKNSKYKLDPEEFGPLEDPRYLYVQNHPPGKELPPDVEDLPPYYVFITTYICYLVLIVVGHIRDFFARHTNTGNASDLKEHDGYAPLFSDFDSFYTRRLKHRLTDCFNRICYGVPGRFIKVRDRYSEDFFYTFKYPGTLSSCLNLSSYNYLGFAQSVGQCTDAAELAVRENGTISPGVRASGGTSLMHLETERIVADFVGKEDAAVFSMGYATNANIFATLVDKNCLVISDELNHASIRFGVRVSKAVIKIFQHNDMDSLEKLLREQISQGQPRTHRPWKKILVVVEGLYSMEGTMCNLPRLIELRNKYKIYLFVDEAHSIGAMGKNGRGVCDYFSIDPSNVDILMGTLTKSFGATGGYIAGDKTVIDCIRSQNMGNLYAESIAPPVLAQIQSSLKTISGEVRPGEGQERLQRLAFNSRYLRLGLHRLGYIVSGAEDSPIIPLMLYHPAKMPAFSRLMLERKIAVVVVGYPATPLTSSRVRLCVSAALTKSDLDRLLFAIEECGTRLRLKMSQATDKNGQLYRWSFENATRNLVEDVHKDWSTL